MEFLELMKREAPAKNQTSRSLFTNVEQLNEGAAYTPSTGNLTLTVIKPGWSKNNRYYSPELLKKSVGIFEGCKMFADHATDKQAAERPEGSVKDWVATINHVQAESDGTLKATASVHDEGFKTTLSNLKRAGNLSQMGVSIRAFGEAKDGEAEGRKGKIIESLLGARSVDFVTFAAAGGRVESMSESVNNIDGESFDLRELQIKTTMMLNPDISEADARRVLDLPPIEVAQLGRRAVAEYTFARKCGISEADATVIAKLGGSQYRKVL
jgi:hypothetical protein